MQQQQQRQEVLRLLSTLTPEQREQLSRLPPAAQVRLALDECPFIAGSLAKLEQGVQTAQCLQD